MPRHRTTTNYGLIGSSETSLDGNSYVPYLEYSASTKEEVLHLMLGDEGHYGYPDFPKNSNVGGDFWKYGVTRTRDRVPARIWTGRSGISHNVRYTGDLVADYQADPPLTDTSGAAWGAEAYRRMRPDKPSMDVSQAIGELKDLPGMLRQRFHGGLRDIGSYYLALKFGWEPLLADIRKLYNLQQVVDKRIKQLLRDNGKPVRRRVQLYSDTQELAKLTTQSYGIWLPSFVTYMYRKEPVSTLTSTLNDKVWASAQFRYWLPPGPRDLRWTSKLKSELMGLTPTPATIYNLIPWTWLIDWFTNAGDVIENLTVSIADRCAADYFYLMREKSRVQNRWATFFARDFNGRAVDLHGGSQVAYLSRSRTKGDPFGLNTNQNTLTGMQWSILGALGLSRLR